MIHRGPGGEGDNTDSAIGMGMRRRCIIDGSFLLAINNIKLYSNIELFFNYCDFPRYFL